MPNIQLVITGQVLFTESTLPISGIRIEIWDSVGTYGLIATSYSDFSGGFNFYLNSPFSDLLNNSTITPLYKTYRGNVLISNTQTNPQNSVLLSIAENDYDTDVKDIEDNVPFSYMGISGIITDTAGNAASEVQVNVYEKGFRNETLIAQTITNINGQYASKVSMRAIANTIAIANRCIVVKANFNSEIIATSNEIYWSDESNLVVNLVSDDLSYTPPSRFENLIEKITYILNGSTTFESFAAGVAFEENEIIINTGVFVPTEINKANRGPINGDGNGELAYIAKATGCDITDVQLITKSYQLAITSGVGHDFMYSLMAAGDLIQNPIVAMDEATMRNQVNLGINNNLIPAHSELEIDEFISDAKDYQIVVVKNIPIVGETYTIETVLNSVFAGQTAVADTNDFLEKYNNEYADIKDFWSYYSGIDPQKAEIAERGLNLASITGFQPEMISKLMVETSSGIFVLAAWSLNDWIDCINTVSQQASKLCVPASIIGNLTDPQVITELYAKKLRSVVQDLYPLTAFNVKLVDNQQGPTLIVDQSIRIQVIDFIVDNPTFDLRVNNVYDINAENQEIDTSNVQDFEEVQQAMAPLQRMFRLIGGNPDATARLMVDKLSSYAAIAAVSSDDFVFSYSSLLGTADAAYAAHAKATALGATAAINFSSIYQNNAQNQVGVLNWPHNPNPPVVHVDPNIKTLFGSTSYCACEQCLSVYSPAAYFTDILNFLRSGIPGSPLPNVYGELIRRRPDLEHIDMTCKNTNTVIPYIDLVIELLEVMILKRMTFQPALFIPSSFQTSGTVKELAAHPEHVYKRADTVSGIYVWEYLDYEDYVIVYNPLASGYTDTNKNLTNAVYPFNLPFSLPAAETRTYLSHLGYSRYDMMRLFQPYYLPTNISDFSIYGELLGITEEEAKIIADSHSLSSDIWLFYGLSSSTVINLIDPSDMSAPLLSGAWDTLLTERLDLLIQQLKVPYKLFLQFLTTDFLNKQVSGTREITVTSKDLDRPDTCDLSKLKLVFTGSATPSVFLGKLHRFVRLWHTQKMSVSEWDKLFTSILITGLDATEFELIGRILQFSGKLNMKPVELAGWWYYLDIHQYVDYGSELLTKQPSLYDLLYRNRSVLNLPLPEFADLGGQDPAAIPPADLPSQFEGFTAAIAAANNIKETDLLLILKYMSITDLPGTAVTLGALSGIYFFSTLCKKLGYSVSDLLKVLYLLKIDIEPPVAGQIDIAARLGKLSTILMAVDAINNSSLSLLEIDFLVENYSETGPVAPAPLNIQFFFERLRTELQKFPIYTGPAIPVTADDITAYNKLTNIIYQGFSKEFNVPSEWVTSVLPTFSVPVLPVSLTVVEFLISSDFVTSTVSFTPDELTISPLIYPVYQRVYKIALVSQKFRLNSSEFQYLFLNPATLNFDFTLLPVTGLATHPLLGTLFAGLLQMSRWINLRDRLSLIEDQLVLLLKAANNDLADVNASMAIWQSIINRDQWGTMLSTLIGNSATIVASTPAGLLNARFPEDFVPSAPESISKIWGMIGIMNGCLRTGLQPTTLQAALLQNLIMADSHQVLLAAKGKHTDDEWAAIAKPLRDTLRKKQRDALVGFVVSRPDPVANPSNIQKWRNENDLYAYLLIDVEMEACMKTSRIKQAICSAQLYIDRVLLGLEYNNGNVTSRITMPANMEYQWNQWRAWYRIWEANRKVFLYPENWIEPELRDEKSIFFTEMEDVLFQGDVTEKRAEEALYGYLRKLQEVGQLEPMAVCDTKDPVTLRIITHVLARTYSDPHRYFYRRLINNQWTPWERLDIEVRGEHVNMIVWKNQLYLFWLTMREKQTVGRAPVITDVLAHDGYNKSKWFYNDKGRPNSDTSTNDPSPTYIKQIEITVNWSEYKDGQWKDQQVGKEKMNLDINPIIHKYYSEMFPNADISSAPTLSPALSPNLLKLYKFLSKDRSFNITELIMARIALITFESGDGGSMFLMIQMANTFRDEWEYANNIHAFTFTKDRGVKIWDFYFGGRVPAVARTAYFNNKCVNWYRIEDDGSNMEKLLAHNTNIVSSSAYCYPDESIYAPIGQTIRNYGYSVLNKSPNGRFSVVGYSNIRPNLYNVLEKGFFYNDNKYGFFARPVNISSGISLASAAETAAGYYHSGIPFTPIYGSSISIAAVFATQKFYFQSFFHGRVNDFLKTLNSGGVDGFMKIQTQDQNNSLSFGAYSPGSLTYSVRTPVDKVDFEYDAAYSSYNWELFFHMPLLIAKRLSDNQQFEEARKWYHYIFDPTCNIDASGAIAHHKQRFWRFRPFYDAAGAAIASVDDLLAQINAGNAAALEQLQVWMDNPFKPHVIARMRILSYMKNVVMCYMDNLIAWADKLYRQDTIESLNQATNLYIVVANILGEKPQEVPKRISTGPRTFSELAAAGLDAFSNAMVSMENYIDPNSGPVYVSGSGSSGTPPVGDVPLIKLFYYCLPNNPKLLAYWDTIANRLFNIRNCRNIDGQLRELPLYDAPIDPALLVRAAAMGIDASSVLDDLSSPPMPYRFTVMLQKANELCNDVKALGGALLSTLEKRDAEELALLRSSQEIAVLESMRNMKKVMIDEAAANIEAMIKSKDVAQVRLAYYSSRPYKIPREVKHLSLLDEAQKHQNKASILSAIASVVSIFPQVNLQIPFAVGPSFGGQQMAAVLNALSTIQSMKASMKSTEANKTITEAGYERRRDDWQFQAESAQKEIIQIEKQIISAQIRKNIAEKDLATQELQIANAKATDEYMHEKYTNIELYSWMLGQVSSSYFQAYQFAYDIAKRAEKSLRFELPWITPPGGSFIKFGYWDSLKKGLMSGEIMQYDLRKMEIAYLEANGRELELTKHISLAMENPLKLLELRETGMCSIPCDADMFDFDYPGHYLRRVKSVSISIPCVAGPYITISATLSQSGGVIELVDSAGAVSTYPGNSSSIIALSGAQNDSGMFELNLRDERFLPFEGSGAICTWNLSLMNVVTLRQFDYNTISDVIIHVKYTAQNNELKRSLVTADMNNRLNSIAGTAIELPRYFSLKHEFANSWFAFANAFASDTNTQMQIGIDSRMFAYFCQNKKINLLKWDILLKPKSPLARTYKLEMEYEQSTLDYILESGTLNAAGNYTSILDLVPDAVLNPGGNKLFKLRLIQQPSMDVPVPENVNMNDLLDDIYLVATFTLSLP